MICVLGYSKVLAQDVFNNPLIPLYIVKGAVVEDAGSDLGHTDVELELAQRTGRAKKP